MAQHDDNVRPAPEIAFGDDLIVEDIDLNKTEVIIDGQRLRRTRR